MLSATQPLAIYKNSWFGNWFNLKEKGSSYIGDINCSSVSKESDKSMYPFPLDQN